MLNVVKHLAKFVSTSKTYALLFILATCSLSSCYERSVYDPLSSEYLEDLPTPVGKEVDLGLSVKWANHNVGAAAPEEYGNYYAWGETRIKLEYYWEDYKYYNSSTDDFDNIGSNISGTSYDVAHVRWGGGWRMPTLNEIKELINKCSWQWTTVNGVNGYKVTGPNGNSIFLPAAGYRLGTELYYRGSNGIYWSGTLYENISYYAYFLNFGSGNRYWDYNSRGYGFSVRPVTE